MAAYKEVFWKYDADGSGTIDVRELYEMLKSMGRDIPISEVLDIVAHFDQDGKLYSYQQSSPFLTDTVTGLKWF